MYQNFCQRVQFLTRAKILPFLCLGKKGIEKENIRIDELGKLSLQAEPIAFGKALTNKYITKDYADAMLEMTTSPYEDLTKLFSDFYQLHIYIYKNLTENLWLASAPPPLPKEVKIAQFGQSNKAQLKEIYRTGLKHRYGDLAQLFSGVHFNYSFHRKVLDEFIKQGFATDKNQSYFGTARNFLRYEFLIIYLFGSSPFSQATLSNLEKLPFATCMRALVYKNKSDFYVSFNSLQEYIRDLLLATQTTDDHYQKIGVKKTKYLQLNANKIQIENEFYCPVRPKPIAVETQRPLLALREHGVHYIECRSLDLDPFSPTGIELDTGFFLETFFLFCLLLPSALMSKFEMTEILNNSKNIALEGRKEQCFIFQQGVKKTFLELANEIFRCLKVVADLLDQASRTKNYSRVIAKQKEVLANPQKTPSAKLVVACQDTSFHKYILQKAIEQKQYFLNSNLSQKWQEYFETEAGLSFKKWEKLEQLPQVSFDIFLKNYFAI